MTDKLDDAALAAIRARHKRDERHAEDVRYYAGEVGHRPVEGETQAHKDRAALLAEVERLRADAAALREALSEAARVLARAHDRIHSLPRTSDTELAERIGTTNAKIRAALARAGGGS